MEDFFCQSLRICIYCFIGFESSAATIRVRCPYIYFLDSTYTFFGDGEGGRRGEGCFSATLAWSQKTSSVASSGSGDCLAVSAEVEPRDSRIGDN